MDNVAHTLVGYSLGKLVGTRKKVAPAIQKGIVLAGMVSSNLPDFDMPLGGDRLQYLLHHRGWTHTVLFLPIIAIASVLIARLITKVSYRDAFKYFSITALIGVALHIGADFCNDYGVHPFAPFNNHWYYGDFLFIVEPAVWFSMIPLVVMQAKGRWTKGFWILVGFGMFFVVWAKPYTPFLIACGLTVWLTVTSAVQWIIRRKSFQASATALASFALVLSVFFSFSRWVRSEVSHLVQGPVEMATTPAPSNPFCWRVLVAQTQNEKYFANLGVMSLAPSYFKPETCYVRMSKGRTAKLNLSPFVNGDPRFHWMGQFTGNLVELKSLSQSHCDFKELLKFARVPFWVKNKHSTIVGDLRYDFSDDLGFAKFEVEPQYKCSQFVPPWQEPITKLTSLLGDAI
jgi:inner membrane protein